ncbi:MAG: hypothetical protein WC966_07365 [Bradymonadales bacterium]|jgi:hypothetical protein
MRYIFFLFLVFSLVSCSAKTEKTKENAPNTESAAKQELKEEKSLRLSISSDYAIWKSDNNASVDIVIENNSNDSYVSSSLPFLILYDEENTPRYWTLVDLSNALSLEAEQYSVVSLASKKVKRISPVIAKLMWQRTDSEERPNAAFYDIVEPGNYSVRFEMNIFVDKVKSDELNSNRIDVVVQK